MSDHIGQQFGNYQLVSLLGRGGYAEVYLGQHVRLNLQAAIKILHTHLTDPEAAHFQQEAETIATLVHPSIVRIFDFDVQDGMPFLVMDYAPNGSLRRRYPKGQIVPLPQIVSYVKQVAAALQYAHERKFIHRDVKPENMLLGRTNEVLLSDFGLAALAHSSGSLSTQEAVGTLPYMAPEQIEGHPRAASDQYALGVVVYEWLCGTRPFEGSMTEVMVQHLTMPPPPLHEKVATIPSELEQVVLRTLAKDPKARFTSVQDFAAAFEQASQRTSSQLMQFSPDPSAVPRYATVAVVPGQVGDPTEATPSADVPREALEPTVLPVSPASADFTTPPTQAATTPAVRPSPWQPALPIRQRIKSLPTFTVALLIGLAVLVVAGGILGSLSLLAHFGVLSTHSGPPTIQVARGGTWIDEVAGEPASLLPNPIIADPIDPALYLPLFYGDAQGAIHPGAASEVPTVQNGGISADAKTWTFHLRPGLVWSDGQPYDARDVDYSWKLWLNPKYGSATAQGYDLISSTDVSADHLSITFHLKQPYAPFGSFWVDGFAAPMPMHHFSGLAPETILKEVLNPKVVSGPFLLSEYVPGDHITLVRNPRYYRASAGLPYLDKVIIRNADVDTIMQDLQAGTITSAWNVDLDKLQAHQPPGGYTFVTPPATALFEGMFFNFHNVVLATHPEVRLAMAMAIDHPALIQTARHGFATQLCTDHGSFYHPGYEVTPPCPPFDPAAANKLLSDNGWVKGPDGVRTRGGQRLEFEYSTNVQSLNVSRVDAEAILQRNFRAIGIKLDIQNYPLDQIFKHLLPEGKASPSTGAVAGRYDIAEFATSPGYNPSGSYDPDDSSLLSCDQIPPKGYNVDFYCNPALDALYKQEQATVDPGTRQRIFAQIHEIYLSELPFITLHGVADPSIVRKGAHNYLSSSLVGDWVNIWQWWCDNGKC